MQTLTPYATYKDSRAATLGAVPEHWDLLQLGRIGRFSKGSGGSKEDEAPNGMPCIRYGDIYMHYQFFVQRSFSFVSAERASAYTPIQYGDILFAASGETIEDIGKSTVNLIPTPACCGGDLLIFRPSIQVNPRFMGYASDCHYSVSQKSRMGRGITIMHIYDDDLKYLWLAMPPLDEQNAIVRFLDYANRRIWRVIRAKRQLIRLLEEQNQAAVSRAVSRGINPEVSFQPSGVSWFGEMPTHWEMRRNGRLFAERNETGYADLPILEVSLRTGVQVRDLSNIARKQIMSDRDKYKRARKGDIAYNMMRMWQGAVGVAPQDGLVSPAYVVAAPLEGVDTRYYANLFRTPAYMGEVNACSRGIVKDRNRLYWEDFKQISSPYPPPEEQLSIAGFIETYSGSIGNVIAKVNHEVKSLLEYRTRLIADVVSGKVDVRDLAASLPDEVEEADEPDVGAETLEDGDDETGLTEGELTEEEVVA
jgi:type I restriction enzyme S subunit